MEPAQIRLLRKPRRWWECSESEQQLPRAILAGGQRVLLAHDVHYGGPRHWNQGKPSWRIQGGRCGAVRNQLRADANVARGRPRVCYQLYEALRALT